MAVFRTETVCLAVPCSRSALHSGVSSYCLSPSLSSSSSASASSFPSLPSPSLFLLSLRPSTLLALSGSTLPVLNSAKRFGFHLPLCYRRHHQHHNHRRCRCLFFLFSPNFSGCLWFSTSCSESCGAIRVLFSCHQHSSHHHHHHYHLRRHYFFSSSSLQLLLLLSLFLSENSSCSSFFEPSPRLPSLPSSVASPSPSSTCG